MRLKIYLFVLFLIVGLALPGLRDNKYQLSNISLFRQNITGSSLKAKFYLIYEYFWRFSPSSGNLILNELSSRS